MRLDHLVSLTFGCSYDYALGEDSMHIGWIIDTGNSGIEYEQHRMLGLDDDGNPTYPYYAIKSMVAAWQAKKSFKLYAEAKVYDLYDKRSRVLPLVGINVAAQMANTDPPSRLQG